MNKLPIFIVISDKISQLSVLNKIFHKIVIKILRSVFLRVQYKASPLLSLESFFIVSLP
jgi:hypothetical protein